MPILDSQASLSRAQGPFNIGDNISTDIYDTGSAADTGIGEEVFLVVSTVAAPVGAGSTTAIVLQDSADASTWAAVQVNPAFTIAQMGANRELVRMRLPVGLRRFFRVVYRVETANQTAGTYNAFVALNLQANNPYASGFTVA